jgi:hypothetical protein
MVDRREVEIVATKGKGWMLAGGILMGLGVLALFGGGGSSGGSAIFLGAIVHGIGRVIRWYHRV